MTTARRIAARSICARSVGARNRFACAAVAERIGAQCPTQIHATRIAEAVAPTAFFFQNPPASGRVALALFQIARLVQFDLRALCAQRLSGQFAMRKARANRSARGAPTPLRDGVAREPRTTIATVQARVSAAIAFSRRQMALIPCDGAQNKTVERADLAMQKRRFHFMRATARAPQSAKSARPNSSGTPR